MVPLTVAAYGDIRAGRLAEGEITLADVETFDLPGTFDVSLCSIAIDRLARSPRSFALLVGSLLDVICAMVRRGIALRAICVQAWTPQTVLMCRRLGFYQTATPSGTGPDPGDGCGAPAVPSRARGADAGRGARLLPEPG